MHMHMSHVHAHVHVTCACTCACGMKSSRRSCSWCSSFSYSAEVLWSLGLLPLGLSSSLRSECSSLTTRTTSVCKKVKLSARVSQHSPRPFTPYERLCVRRAHAHVRLQPHVSSYATAVQIPPTALLTLWHPACILYACTVRPLSSLACLCVAHALAQPE